MSVYLPPELIPLFSLVTGSEWENLDTDAVFAGGHDLQTVADRIRTELAPEISLAVRSVQQGIEGQANAAFVDNMASYTERDRKYLYAAATQYETLATFVSNAAMEVQYVQIMIFMVLALLLIQIVWAY